jgi:hypothetical protein
MQTTVAFLAKIAASKPVKKKKLPEFGGLQSPATWLAGAGALGAGGLGAAHGLGSDEQIARVLDAARQYDPKAFTEGKLPPNYTGLTYYEKLLSPGAQLKPFGIPVGELLVKLRSSPAIMKALGTEPYLLADRASQRGAGGAAHYEMFSRGPVPAYMHQIKSRLSDLKVPENIAGSQNVNYSDWMGRKFEDFLTSETKQRINPFEINPSFMSNEDQVKTLERFHQSLPAELQQYRIDAENPGPAYATQTVNYLPKAKAYAQFRDILKNTGITASGAAAGGGLGNTLYNLMTDKSKRTSVGRWAAALAGGGLGGAGSYLVGTEPGRAISGAWLKTLIDKLSRNT